MESSRSVTYGLGVRADYTSVVFGAPRLQFAGAGKLEDGRLNLAGDGELIVCGQTKLEIRGYGHLLLKTEGITFSTIVSFLNAGKSLRLEYRGSINNIVRLEHTIELAEGAVYEEIAALRVTGQLDMMTTVVHGARSSSDIRSRVVLEGSAKAIIRGEIVMTAGAAGSVGFERMDALLLEDGAEANLMPMLKVQIDDVRCKHAASTAHPEAEHLFYLQSRGLSVSQAKELIAQAFLQ